MSRLFSAPAARADARPALLAVISLLLIVLPLLLASGERVGLSGLPLSVPADGALAPVPHPGPVHARVIQPRPAGLPLAARVPATPLPPPSPLPTLPRQAAARRLARPRSPCRWSRQQPEVRQRHVFNHLRMPIQESTEAARHRCRQGLHSLTSIRQRVRVDN